MSSTGADLGTDPIVRGYATAIFSVAQAEGALERVADELYSFAQAVGDHADLRERLADPGIDTGAKLGIVSDLLGGRAHPQTVSAVAYIVQSGRTRQLSEITRVLANLGAESRSEALAVVRTAVALDPAQQRKLAEALGRSAGQPVDLKVVIDPGVVGGLVVTIGDTVIDGSVSRRLAELKAALTGV